MKSSKSRGLSHDMLNLLCLKYLLVQTWDNAFNYPSSDMGCNREYRNWSETGGSIIYGAHNSKLYTVNAMEYKN